MPKRELDPFQEIYGEPSGDAGGPAPARGPVPGMGDLAGPVSWASVLGALPCIAAAFGLAIAQDAIGGGAWGIAVGVASLVVLQGGWFAPAMIARWTLRAVIDDLTASERRLRVLAPAFFLAFIVALPLALFPLVAIPLLVFGPIPLVRLGLVQTRGHR